VPPERVERKLAAILAADVAGYSRLMGVDEAGTLAQLKAHRRELIDPKIAEHRGRVVKTTGDGILIEFPSVVEAVGCAIEVQQGMVDRNADVPEDKRITFRVGVNLGDIIIDGDDIHGDGVNIAARLEAMAEPGMVCLSAAAWEQVRGKVPFGADDLGEHQLKNIERPVRVFRIASGASATAARKPLPLPGKPSIAVLPFTNMSGDPEQEYFADGLTEDLITDLSKVPSFFVIARNSSFYYKGKSVDVRQIAREMGVRYILEGSARRSSGRVRINAQLIDAVGGGHLWAERFDRDLANVFAVQDEVVGKIVGALAGKLSPRTLAVPRPPANLEAYECVVRGRWLYNQPKAFKTGRLLLEKAVILDPAYAEAHAWLAVSYWASWVFWNEPADPYRALALTAAGRAVALDPNDPMTHFALGLVQLYERCRAEAAAAFQTALRLNPNFAETWNWLSELMLQDGRPLDAIDCALKAMRLNPHPPGNYYWALGQAQYAARRYDDAIATLRHEDTYATGSRRTLAAALAQSGRVDEAHEEGTRFMAGNPQFTISYWASIQPGDDAVRQHFVDGYRKAGLPE
jgi:TolB-like protein